MSLTSTNVEDASFCNLLFFSPFTVNGLSNILHLWLNWFRRCTKDVPYCDSFPNARAGWLDTLNEDMKAPDVLNYHPPPAHLLRQVSFSDLNSGEVKNGDTRPETKEEQ